MIANTHKVLFVATTLLALIGLFSANGAFAYFEFDHDQLWGQKVVKTVLRDGRIRMHVPHHDKQPLPEAIRNAIESKAEKPIEYDPDTMHFSGHYDVTMSPNIKMFKVDEHSDTTRMVCHEDGDMNMRLSLFGASQTLLDALKQNEDYPVILTAKASEHQCHGKPIFRKIVSHRVISGTDEVVLVTSKARYEELWDEADIDISVQHPLLTHVNTHGPKHVFYDLDTKDHGINWNKPASTKGATIVSRSPNLVYRTEKMDNDKGGLFSKVTGSHVYQVKGFKPSNGVVTKSQNRKAEALWGCGCSISSITKAVTNVVKTVTTTATQAVSTVTAVAEAAGKGIVSAANTLANLLTFSADEDRTLEHTFSSCDTPGTKSLCDKPMIGLLVTFEMKFTTTFRFKFKISSNTAKLFMTTLTGALSVGAGARTQSYQDGSGQVTLFTIPGPKITFMISIIPVWIDVTFPILGGVSITYGTKDKPFSAGYSITASATIGVQWTEEDGFTMLTSKEFTKGYELNYPRTAPAEITVAPYVGVQARFALYSMVVGYPQIQFGLDNTITVDTEAYCKLRLYTKFVVKLSAGLDFELVLKSITIFRKTFGPWELFKLTVPVYNFCMREIPTLPPFLNGASSTSSSRLALAQSATALAQHSQEHQLHRAADLLADPNAVPPPTTQLTTTENGKVWTDTQFCPNTNETINFEVTGFFADSWTFLYVVISRNVTNTDGNYTLAQQSMLTFIPRNLTLGMSSYSSLVPVTEDVANQINISYDKLSQLTTASSGSPKVTSIPLTDINFTFSATDLDKVDFYSPLLCGGKKINSNSSGESRATVVTPSGDYAAQLIARLGPQFADSFISMITGTLAIVLTIAIIEIVIVILLPRIVGAKFFPKKAEQPRYREYVYGVVSVVVGSICYLMFIIGGALQYADITGARVDPHYRPPPPGANQGDFLTASGVEILSYEFAGADVKVLHCPQYYPCSPNCRDLCDSRTFKWTNTPWPYCSKSAIITESGGCTMFAWDAIIDAVFSVLFLFAGCALPLIKFSNIYRRMPLSNAFLLLSAMCLSLIQRRVSSFMTEVKRSLFEPADQMITSFNLNLSPTSDKLFQTSVTAFWILCGVQGLLTIHELLDYYKQTKDGKIVHLAEDLMEQVEASQMRTINDKSSVTNFTGDLNDSHQSSGSNGSKAAAATNAFPIAPSLDI